MKSILYDIYNGDYDITLNRDKKQQELYAQLCDEWEKVQAVFGDELIDRIINIEGELDDIRHFHYYREGFRLGIRLMLEALTPRPGNTAPW